MKTTSTVQKEISETMSRASLARSAESRKQGGKKAWRRRVENMESASKSISRTSGQ